MARTINENTNEMGYLRRIALAVELMTANLSIDNDGEPVPIYGSHTFTYDDSGNLKTDRVVDDGNAWVRTYTYQDGQLVADSGWVRQ